MPFETSEHARIAALSRSSRTPGHEISAPARNAFIASFDVRHECDLCGVVEIDQDQPPAIRAQMAAAAMRAHMQRIARQSRSARRRARQHDDIARAAARRLAAELAQLDDAG